MQIDTTSDCIRTKRWEGKMQVGEGRGGGTIPPEKFGILSGCPATGSRNATWIFIFVSRQRGKGNVCLVAPIPHSYTAAGRQTTTLQTGTQNKNTDGKQNNKKRAQELNVGVSLRWGL